MAVTKFETVDGYGMLDVAGAPLAVGPVRSAKKVLQRTTGDLIRHATYALAVHGIDGTGAAAALNHDRSAADPAEFETFAAELETWAASVSFRPVNGIGLSPEEIGPALHASAATSAQLLAASAVAAAGAIGRATIASDGAEAELLAELSAQQIEATVTDDLAAALTSEVEAVFVRSSAGALHHEALADCNVGRIIGLQPLTTTARGLAFAGRNGSVIVPDFVSAGGLTLAASFDAGTADEALDRVRSDTADVAGALATEGTNTFVAACERAEAHLRTWTDELPFGRPLAP